MPEELVLVFSAYYHWIQWMG